VRRAWSRSNVAAASESAELTSDVRHPPPAAAAYRIPSFLDASPDSITLSADDYHTLNN
jgi:hypothetical protein